MKASVKLFIRCILAADCSESTDISMASSEFVLAAFSEAAPMPAVCEVRSKPEVVNLGAVTAWEGDVTGAALAKGEAPGARVGLG